MSARHASCFFWLRQLRRVRRSLDIESVSPCLCHIARRLLQLCFVFRAEADYRQVCSMLKMLRHVWSQPHRDPEIWMWSVTVTCTGWLFLSERSIQACYSIVVFGTELQGTSSTTACQSPKFLVASICDLPEVINCQFHEFAVEPLRPMHFLFPDQQSGIHCLIICVMQLLTPNNSGRTWRRMFAGHLKH